MAQLLVLQLWPQGIWLGPTFWTFGRLFIWGALVLNFGWLGSRVFMKACAFRLGLQTAAFGLNATGGHWWALWGLVLALGGLWLALGLGLALWGLWWAAPVAIWLVTHLLESWVS